MKNVPLKPILFFLMLVTFIFHMISVVPAFAAEIESSSSASESEVSTSTSEIENSSPASSSETLDNTPSLDTENNDPTPKPNPNTPPKKENNSSKAPEKDIITFESAFTSEDVFAIRSDLYASRNLMEEFIYIVLPLCAALLIVCIFCYWFYCTFIKSAL